MNLINNTKKPSVSYSLLYIEFSNIKQTFINKLNYVVWWANKIILKNFRKNNTSNIPDINEKSHSYFFCNQLHSKQNEKAIKHKR